MFSISWIYTIISDQCFLRKLARLSVKLRAMYEMYEILQISLAEKHFSPCTLTDVTCNSTIYLFVALVAIQIYICKKITCHHSLLKSVSSVQQTANHLLCNGEFWRQLRASLNGIWIAAVQKLCSVVRVWFPVFYRLKIIANQMLKCLDIRQNRNQQSLMQRDRFLASLNAAWPNELFRALDLNVSLQKCKF